MGALQAPLQVLGRVRQLVMRDEVLPWVAAVVDPDILRIDAHLTVMLALAICAALVLDRDGLGDLIDGDRRRSCLQPLDDCVLRLALGETVQPLGVLWRCDFLQPLVDLLDLLLVEPLRGRDHGEQGLQVFVDLVILVNFPPSTMMASSVLYNFSGSTPASSAVFFHNGAISSNNATTSSVLYLASCNSSPSAVRRSQSHGCSRQHLHLATTP
eukprot:CAMPEP_0176225752 /NCGR_PEP_ID=MMETSP0121_2-20121125/21916_1 /TAXON_ID=160619 /ORGANISM="Kryptoperidinium foliaceum, Strain CCMP 1326" /LENGTH=212 /DNA_ID=CAMNT_0017565015 /DNA_START=188 /DNA_END=823 /DNA_ORIENTATION=-